MTYEQVLDYLDEHHSDLERTVKLVKDAGTQSIILNLTESKAKKVGPYSLRRTNHARIRIPEAGRDRSPAGSRGARRH